MSDVISKFEQTLIEHLGFPPTQDQSKAANALSRFVFSLNSQVGMILKGYAGTGKTSLIGALVKTLHQNKMKSVLLAPTGRAAKVLASHSGTDAMTIHKKIYFQQRVRGKMVYNLGKNLHKNALFIVDEASMIATENGLGEFSDSRDLLDDLFRYVYNGFNCKILFIGDNAQLPPVGSAFSPALDKSYLEGAYGIPFGAIQLKTVVRQGENSGILYNATKLRVQMLQEDFKLQLECNTQDAVAIDGYTLQDELESSISREGEENVIVICRSNKRANLFNQNIRHRILYHEDEVTPGDLVMVLKNNYFWIDPQSKIGFIANGDTLEIQRIVRFEQIYGFRFADVTVRLTDFPDEPEFDCKIILDAVMSNNASLSWDEQNALFGAIEEDYMDIKDKKKRMAKIMKSPYYNALQIKFAYSVTCHKSQGGQWPIVFIDQGFLPPTGIDYEYMRWLYTAITRARDKAYFVNFNPEFII